MRQIPQSSGNARAACCTHAHSQSLSLPLFALLRFNDHVRAISHDSVLGLALTQVHAYARTPLSLWLNRKGQPRSSTGTTKQSILNARGQKR